jgi:hypothetical protein
VVEPPAATDVGLNVATAPKGSPLTVKPREPENPLVTPVLTVYVAVFPGVIACEPGAGFNVKSGTTPIPFSAIAWGDPEALSATSIVPALVPATEGVKTTLIVQLEPAGSEPGQLLVWE